MESKTEDFSEVQQRAAHAAKLLAHPARLAILEFVGSHNACISAEVMSEIPLSRATVHQHLNVLKEAGWIKMSLSGSKISYCVDYKRLNQDSASLVQQLSKWETTCNPC